METWIIFTFMAAFMQSIRTAGQKKISNYLSPMTTTLVRYMFGVPFAVCYLWIVIPDNPLGIVFASVNSRDFFIYASLASVAQIAATVWLVKVLSFRNFAVATIFSKTEAIQTAVLGVVFFSASLSWHGWLAVILGAIGIFIMGFPGAGRRPESKSIYYGILSGLGFAFTALWLRQASLSLHYTFIQNAAITLVYMVSVQTIMCVTFVAIKERNQIALLMKHIPLAIFVGATSALGSVGWYTAMTYENAALVRSLGQIELVFAVVITYLFFNEKISTRELFGMLIIVLSVLILLLLV
ncbi:MAG: DMT family transporter [Oceanicoccus sp.]